MEKKKKNIIRVIIFFIILIQAVIFTSRVKRIIFSSVAAMITYRHQYFFQQLFISSCRHCQPVLHYMDICMYWLHKPWASKWIGGLQKFHMQHHFGQTEKCFGVTTTWWDSIFNTTGKTEKIAGAKSIELYFGKKSNQDLITHKQAV